MPATELAYLSAAELAALIRTRKISAVEVMRATLDRADQAQPILNCFITICREDALRDAAAGRCRLARGDAIGPCTACRCT